METRSRETPSVSKSAQKALEVLLLTLLLGFSAVLLYVPKETVNLKFDSSVYAAQSMNIAAGRGNTMQWGGEEIPGFYPPGYPAWTAVFHLILGPHIQNGVPANWVAALLVLLGVYCIARRIAGPAAGALALLLLLNSFVFRHVAREVFSQMPSLLLVVLMAGFLLAGWREGRLACLFRFSAGVLCGLSVLIRSNNVVLAPALAVFALLVRPPGQSRLRGALPAWIGIAASAVVVVGFNVVQYGSPLATGYTDWGFDLDKVFSFGYLTHPPFVQMDEGPYPLLRWVTGNGILYGWQVALAALAGLILAWHRRQVEPYLWPMAAFTVLSTLFLYGFLSFYFFRSPIYAMLTVPLIVVVAAAGIVLVLLRLLRPPPGWKGLLLTYLPAAAATGLILPLTEAPLMTREAGSIPLEIREFQGADGLLEGDAVLLGGANPILAEYLFVRDTKRSYLFLTRRQGRQFKRLVRNELGRQPLTMAAVEQYILCRFEEGRTVCLLLSPFQPEEGGLLKATFKFLKKKFRLEETDSPALRRILKKP